MLISCAVTAQLNCEFVFAFAKSKFSHEVAELVMMHLSFRELKLQREHDYYTNKLLDRQKKFQEQLDFVAKQLKDFASKDRMSEAETYMRELTEITEKLEQFQEEVRIRYLRWLLGNSLLLLGNSYCC